MTADNLNEPDQPHDHDSAMSDDPRGGRRLTGKPGAIGRTAAKRPDAGDLHNQPTAEEFGERGMGMAAKE